MIIEAREDVVKLEGRLDKNLWPTIQAAANLLLRHHLEGIIVDGGALTGCSPEGAKTFRDAMDYIERYRARIVVCALPENVMGCIRATPGVRSRLPVTETLEEARASLKLSGPGGVRAGGGQSAPQNILVPLLAPGPSRNRRGAGLPTRQSRPIPEVPPAPGLHPGSPPPPAAVRAPAGRGSRRHPNPRGRRRRRALRRGRRRSRW